MSPDASNTLVEGLIHHESFVRSTLRGLLADEGQIQDALQDTWLKVLGRPASELDSVREPRTWLARIARNVALSTGRTNRSRARRELAAEARGELGSPEDSLVRIETRRKVVDQIVGLEEPYRSVILLRYEQNLETAEIAKKLGRTQATVRSQLSRAQRTLREKLDQEFGDRRVWGALVLPLAIPIRGVLPIAIGVAAVSVVGVLTWTLMNMKPSNGPHVGVPTLASGSILRPNPALSVWSRSQRTEVPANAKPVEIVEEVAVVEDRQVRQLRLPTVDLFDIKFFDRVYPGSFSFEDARREDPYDTLRGDWDIGFSDGKIWLNNAVNDRSFGLDLGELSPECLGDETSIDRPLVEFFDVVEGHSYFFYSYDANTGLAGVLYVRKHTPERKCTLDWYVTDGTGSGQGSLVNPSGNDELANTLVRLRREAIEQKGLLEKPRVFLQARADWKSNPNILKLHMNGPGSYLGECRREPIDFAVPLAESERSSSYFEGGWIPADKAFIVKHIRYTGTAYGDRRRRGQFKLVVGGEVLVDLENCSDPIKGDWIGEIELRPGDESKTYLGITGASTGEVLMEGSLVDRRIEGGFGAQNMGFLNVDSNATKEIDARPMEQPRIVLQARSAAGGGNPNRLDMIGRASIYIDKISDVPLSFVDAPPKNYESVVYLEGGEVGKDRIFVVTRATWITSSTGDSNGGGEFILVVAGETLVQEVNLSESHGGDWTGNLRVVSGEESRTYLEITNSSSADVLLTGYFESL
ncbi:MAG: RNA polymerase sigma-70 factor (ECF subfamily) [Planctomycetota bacterium]|jgi:RNA polymerase sigma-70 factor (ECF subfamily)